MGIAAFLVTLIALPTLIGSITVLWKLHKFNKFDGAAPCKAVVCSFFCALFGLQYTFDYWVRRMNQCDPAGGTGLIADIITGGMTTCFAMFTVLGIIQILLMWIDVYIKSKTMQKVSQENSLIEVYKKVLRRGAIGFASVFLVLFMLSTTLAVAWTFLFCTMLFFIVPVCAMNLVQLLTGCKPESEKFCAVLCHFLRSAVPFALFGKRSPERSRTMASADPNNNAGKFILTRLKMAEKVETLAIRACVCMGVYILSCLVYMMKKPLEGSMEHQQLNVVHWSVMGIFFPMHYAVSQMLAYCRYTLRDAIGESVNHARGRKVSAGLSVHDSSTATEDSAGEDDSA